MSIIWLVEAIKQDFSVAHSLLGNFATRIFSSASSFQKVSFFEKDSKPSLLIIDFEFYPIEKHAELCAHVKNNFAKISCLVLNNFPVSDIPHAHFIRKPVDLFSLIQTVRMMLADAATHQETVSIEDLIFYPLANEIENETSEGLERVKLSRQESLILKALLRNFGKTVSRQVILREAWDNAKVSDRTMDSHISRLRTALAISTRIELQNIYGKGFSLTRSE